MVERRGDPLAKVNDIGSPTVNGSHLKMDSSNSAGMEDLTSVRNDQPGRRPANMPTIPEPPAGVTNDTFESSDNGFEMSPAKRVRTDPVRAQTRPSMQPRKNTLLGGLKRTTTGTPMRRANTFSYEFKEAPLSDSDDSSSSDEDDEEVEKVEAREDAQTKQQVDGSGGESETATTKAKRKHAYSRFTIGNDLFKTTGRVSRKDGRLRISINSTANSGYIAKALGQSIRNHLDIPTRAKSKHGDDRKKRTESEVEDTTATVRPQPPRPRLNIVIMVIGSRGDIQPFLKIGKILRHQYGHRVRIASHPVFRDFVETDGGLEFFSVGGDPSELMAFMVKNPGLIPNMQTLREGEIGRRRAAMAEMFEGFWRACINTTENEHDPANLKTMENMEPFIADAIIANPPSMAHVHIAEKLGVPLHMMFTFPYSPTTQFPHPLANIRPKKSNVDSNYVNFMSYPLVEMMTWQGLGDIVNKFRENTLRLEPVSSLWAPGALYRMKVPYTYLWSPSLVPKPQDWGPEIDIGGFVFLDLASNFKPPKDLMDFLDAGEPPVYIGFGSIVVDDPNAFTDMIFEAVEKAGVRALVNKGWGGLGRHNGNTPKNIFMLENTPHDWLFPRVKAVVHHGGAGTTAIGLKCARPTMIVPFFGDQPFWGAMVAEARAGAFECIPYKRLTADRLAEGIKQCLTKEAQENVQKIADSIAKEGDGALNAVRSFHRSLPLAGRHNMRCSILSDRVAVWQVKKSSLRLSALAAQILHKHGKIKWGDLKLCRHHEWNDFDGPGEPFTGGVGALTDSLYGIGEGFGMVPVRMARHIREHEEHERRKRERRKRREERHRKKAEEEGRVVENGSGEERPVARRELTNDTTAASTASTDPEETLPKEVIHDLHWGLKRAGAAILTMPNDLHVAVAQGLHNAPRLWGDATVRKPTKITGFKSGCTAARKELFYGMYDGWTGLVKQPMGDWEDGETLPAKLAGLGTGIGKGVGGFVLKNANAVYAPPGFVVKGLIKYVENKHEGPGSKSFIRRSQIVQGERDYWALLQQQQQRQQQGDRRGSEDGGIGASQLQKIEAAVEHGWSVYERIWAEAHKEFGPVGGNWVGKYRLKKEQRQWDVNGALENVETAQSALTAREGGGGGDLDRFLEERREIVREAEEPRAPAMTEAVTPAAEKRNVLPNGFKLESTLPLKERQDEQQGAGAEREDASQHDVNDGMDSRTSTTAAAVSA